MLLHFILTSLFYQILNLLPNTHAEMSIDVTRNFESSYEWLMYSFFIVANHSSCMRVGFNLQFSIIRHRHLKNIDKICHSM